MLDHGEKVDWYLQIEADGGHITALDKKPEIYDDLRQDFKAFGQLHASRQSNGWGPCALRIADIVAYMQILEMNDYEERQVFLRRMQILDQAYLQHAHEKMKTSDAQNQIANQGKAPK